MKAGDAVAVFGLSASGRPFLEGSALIHSQCGEAHHYSVQFSGDRVLRTRFINPDWQRDPEHSLAFLLAFWRTGQSESFNEFFPDDQHSAEGTAP